jgi:hypothetical protein
MTTERSLFHTGAIPLKLDCGTKLRIIADITKLFQRINASVGFTDPAAVSTPSP